MEFFALMEFKERCGTESNEISNYFEMRTKLIWLTKHCAYTWNTNFLKKERVKLLQQFSLDNARDVRPFHILSLSNLDVS